MNDDDPAMKILNLALQRYGTVDRAGLLEAEVERLAKAYRLAGYVIRGDEIRGMDEEGEGNE